MKILILAFGLIIIIGNIGNISCKIYNNENIDLTEETVGDENHGMSSFDIPSEISLSRYKREDSPSPIEATSSLIPRFIQYILSFISSVISDIFSASTLLSNLVFKIIFPAIIDGLKIGAAIGIVPEEAVAIVSLIFNSIEFGYTLISNVIQFIISVFHFFS